jgi:hypothetical protein
MREKAKAILKLGFVAWFAFLCAAMEAFHTCVPTAAPTSGDSECADCCSLDGSGEHASCTHAANSRIGQDEWRQLCSCSGECLACFFAGTTRGWCIETAPALLVAMCDGGCVAPAVEHTETSSCPSLSQPRAPPLS